MSLQELAKVKSNEQVKSGYFLMKLEAPKVASEAEPGQFLHIRLDSTLDPLLRRPISLYGIDREGGILSLLYVVVGRGTQKMSEMSPGTVLDIMGPLGRGFWIPAEATRVLVIGGGIGVAPMYPIIERLKEKGLKQQVIYGFRNSESIVGCEKIEELGVPLKIATDDGSAGRKGYVTEIVKEAFEEFKPDYYYCCGPEVMIKRVKELMQEQGIKGQVSLEARMGCGVGACLACTCKTNKSAESGSGDSLFDYSLVCTHGPVFDAGEVIFDE